MVVPIVKYLKTTLSRGHWSCFSFVSIQKSYVHSNFEIGCLVGGFKHFLFSIYLMSSFLLKNSIIFQDGYCTTNQMVNGIVANHILTIY